MKRVRRWSLPVLLVAISFAVVSWRPNQAAEQLPAAQAPGTVAPAPDGWKQVWSDEFDGKAIDKTKWDFDLGNGFYNYNANQWISGWGNDELQYYTAEPANASIKEGMLHLRAVKESLHGCGYTSARMKT
ncbi:MAG: glycoside hydrolase family 16 protein, partial [Gemmataceae bacterium]